MQKRNKAEQVMKKITLNGNITVAYIEHKHKKILEVSVLIHPQNVEKQYHQNLHLDVLLKYKVDFPG